MTTTLKSVSYMGDPHLGKTFRQGVAPDRIGEREQLVQQAFSDHLNNLAPSVKVHICVGDLFDKFRVPEEVILFAFNAYLNAVNNHPDVTYYILQGNHDTSRDSSLASSFEVFAELCQQIPNVIIVKDAPVKVDTEGTDLVLFPFKPFESAAEVVEVGLQSLKPNKGFVAVGHWDIKDFGEIIGEANGNMIPYDLLSGASRIVSGHYHTPCDFDAPTGVPVSVIGSLQPYSHAEDPSESWYVTRTKDEVLEQIEADPEIFKLKNLRVVCSPNDPLEEVISCLSLKVIYKDDAEEDLDLAVSYDEFDLKTIFFETMAEHEVGKDLTETLWGELQAFEE